MKSIIALQPLNVIPNTPKTISRECHRYKFNYSSMVTSTKRIVIVTTCSAVITELIPSNPVNLSQPYSWCTEKSFQ